MDNIINDLENRIKYLAQKYYEGDPVVSDYEFDKEVDNLREICPDSKILNQVGWGYDISKVSGKKIRHEYQIIGSLTKVKSISNIRNSIIRDQFIISAKLDGLSAVAYYKSGVLVRGITRGNGTIGIDITEKLSKIIPNNLDVKFSGSIRGELIISFKNWKEIKKISNASNPRNYAVGIINRNNITDDLKYISFVPYNIIGSEEDYDFTKNMNSIFDWLSDRFDTVPHSDILTSSQLNLSLLNNYYKEFYNDYPIDGLVITNYRPVYDITYKTLCYDQQAYKFNSERANVKVDRVIWTLTRTSRLTPVLEFEPVELCGASISHATAFNAKFISDNKIGSGTIIEIERSNEVIPDIQRVIETPYKSNDNILPDKCPVCRESLIWKGVDLVCNNPDCDSKDFRNLQTWMINIGNTDGISWTLMEKFLTELDIYSIEDLYNNPEIRFNPENSGTQKLIFNKVLDKLFNEPVDAVNALCALNIPRLGKVSAEKLATNVSLIDALMSFVIDGYETSIEELEYDIMKLVGQATATSIMNNLNKISRLKYVRDRLIFNNKKSGTELIKVAVTGKLSVKRSDFEKELNNAGYVIASVNKDCKFLITDNPNGTSSKNKKASELGIEKITESKFRELYL